MGDSSKEAQGERLKWARSRARIKPEDFARAVRMPYSTYMNYENGFRRLRADQAVLFAERLGLEVKWLATGDGPRFAGKPHPMLEILEKLPAPQQAFVERMVRGLAIEPDER